MSKLVRPSIPRCSKSLPQPRIVSFVEQKGFGDVPILRRYRRPLLLRLERTHRPTLEDHVHRSTRLGSSRSLEDWYKTREVVHFLFAGRGGPRPHRAMMIKLAAERSKTAHGD